MGLCTGESPVGARRDEMLNTLTTAARAFDRRIGWNRLGNAFLLGLGMLYEPQAASAVDQLPPWLNRVLAMTILGAIFIYVAWVTGPPRVVGRNDWQVVLPRAPLTLVQIGIGVLDLGSAAVAMYVLL